MLASLVVVESKGNDTDGRLSAGSEGWSCVPGETGDKMASCGCRKAGLGRELL